MFTKPIDTSLVRFAFLLELFLVAGFLNNRGWAPQIIPPQSCDSITRPYDRASDPHLGEPAPLLQF